jgi:thiol-disulfide isomerase/thioredoxin
MIAALLAVIGLAPLLSGGAWANAAGPPPTQGRVTIVDVFTFACVNCQHVTPELRRLRAAYAPADLTLIGVHTPELPEERVHSNVVAALREQGIAWPVVYDDDQRLWDAFGVSAWPTQLVFDRHGRLRATIVGEGYDRELERVVHQLVGEHA